MRQGMEAAHSRARRERPRGDRRLRLQRGPSIARKHAWHRPIKILAALDQLQAGAAPRPAAAGIQLAYQVAQENFIKGAINRVILCTDGDFNVGVTSTADLQRMAETNAKDTGVFLTVLGFGRGNLNDAMMEQVADKGNGNYPYIDTPQRRRARSWSRRWPARWSTIAKDVKIQVEFNPAQVAAYRLIGYENRMLANEDFNDDKKGRRRDRRRATRSRPSTKIVPAGEPVASAVRRPTQVRPQVDGRREGRRSNKTERTRCRRQRHSRQQRTPHAKNPLQGPRRRHEHKARIPHQRRRPNLRPVNRRLQIRRRRRRLRHAAARLRHKGNATYAAAAEIAESASKNRDPHGYRQEFVDLVKRIKNSQGE